MLLSHLPYDTAGADFQHNLTRYLDLQGLLASPGSKCNMGGLII